MERKFKMKDTIHPEEEFYAFVRTLPPNAQEFIADLSNIMLEPDVHDMYAHDQHRLGAIEDELLKLGAKKNQVGEIMKYFNLSIKKPFPGKQ